MATSNQPCAHFDVTSGRESVGTCEHYQEMVRLRRNLHDGLGPGLAGIMMRADVLGSLMTANQGAAEEMLLDLRREAAAFLAEFRRVLADKGPVELEGHRLDDALHVLGERMSRASGGTLTVTVDVDPAVAEADRAAQVAAFWIAKEALTNVIKHARATAATIRVRFDSGLNLSIVDNGVGGAGRGTGVASMGGRAEELGGWCEVRDGEPGSGVGVTVTAHLPDPFGG